jgi:hypothetical protein
VAQEIAAAVGVGQLEAAHQLVERAEHLLGEARC